MMAKQSTTTSPPFSSDRELYAKLYIDPDTHDLQRRPNKGEKDHPATLPGHPHISLNGSLLAGHLIKEFCTTYLDEFVPHLWLVATQSHSHISSLTHQIVRGRNIIITEDPKLHLLWYHDRVFIKPLPPYLLSHAFWMHYLVSSTSPFLGSERKQILPAARGYLRTWCFLIQHKSDFDLATCDPKLPLLPKNVSFGKFMRFLAECKESISDGDVSPRYRFGELRLSRINFWSRVFLKNFTYHKVSGQYSDYFSRYFGVILFVFAFFSTALSAMQVALAALGTANVPAGGLFDTSWNTILLVSGWFSAAVLIFVASIIVALGLQFGFMIGREAIFAGKDFWRKRKGKRSTY